MSYEKNMKNPHAISLKHVYIKIVHSEMYLLTTNKYVCTTKAIQSPGITRLMKILA